MQELLAGLNEQFEKASAEKAIALETVKNGKMKLNLAQRLTAALATEGARWTENIKKLRYSYELLVGDVLLASAFISYIGPFTKTYREFLIDDYWVPFMKEAAKTGDSDEQEDEEEEDEDEDEDEDDSDEEGDDIIDETLSQCRRARMCSDSHQRCRSGSMEFAKSCHTIACPLRTQQSSHRQRDGPPHRSSAAGDYLDQKQGEGSQHLCHEARAQASHEQFGTMHGEW